MKMQSSRLKQFLSIVMFLALPMFMAAQFIQVQSATKQSWHAGFSYHHGMEYALQFHISEPKAKITIDSLWLDGLLYTLPNSSNSDLSIQIDETGQSITLNAHFEWSGPGYQNINPDIAANAPSPSRTAPDTDGVLFYRHDGIRHRLSLGDIVELMGIGFP